MGLVKMAEEITGEWEDSRGISPNVTATLYIYCDRCGTFNIRTRLGYRRVFLIMFICILLAIGILVVPERLTQKQYRGYFPDNDNMDDALLSPAGLPPENGSMISGMRNDLDGSNGLLFFILAAPFFIIYTVIFPILVMVYLLWTEVISKLFAAKSPRENP